MRAQVRQALRNLSRVLGVLGGRMADILSLTQFTVDVEAFMNAADVRREFFSEPYPVTTTVQVARLYDPALPRSAHFAAAYTRSTLTAWETAA